MSFKAFRFFFVLFFSAFSTYAQNCTLDLGGDNIEMIVKVFQLNEEQIGIMEQLRSELEITTKTVQDDIQKLFDEHPQSTTDDLTAMAVKYKVLQTKLVEKAIESDTKLLSVFNEKQYERYLILCNEAIRDPIRIVPVQIKDSLDLD